MASIYLDIFARDHTSGVLKGVGTKMQGVAGKVKSSIKSAFSPTELIGAATGGSLAIGAFGASSVKAFSDAQAAQSKLTGAFKKFPQLAGANADGLRSLNTQLQKKTKYDDDATAAAQASLAGFGLTEGQLKTITPLLQDYASRTGKDLPSAAQDLGKAMVGQGRALKGIGVNFKDTGTEAGNFSQLVGDLQGKVGGFAEREGTTAAGKMAILRNQVGELQEKVGGALLPVLVKIADFMATKLIPAISSLGSFVARNKTLFVALGIGITAALVPAFIAWAAAAIPAAAATVIAAAPVIALGIAVGALALLVIKNWDTIKGAFKAAAGFIGGVISGVIGFIRDHWQLLLAILTGPFGLAVLFIKDHFNGIVDFVTGLPGKIGRAAKGMFDGIKDAFKAAINFVIKGWDSLHFKIPGFKVGPVHFGGFDLGLPHIKPLAKGGIVTSPTLALIGEAGPEAVVPLNGRFGRPTWQGDINVDARGIEPNPQVGEYVSRFVGWKLGLMGGD